MEFFLSFESEAPAAVYLSQLQKFISPRLKELESNNYGEELTIIAIISIVLRNERFEEGGFPERKLFQRKQRSADIRLRIDFDKFVKGPATKRYDIYVDHILKSIYTLEKKLSKDFPFQKLIRDVESVLGDQELRNRCSTIHRWF